MALLGLPLAIVLAWAFDITPDGVRRTPARSRKARAEGGRPADARAAHSRGLGYLGTGFLLALVGLGVVITLTVAVLWIAAMAMERAPTSLPVQQAVVD